MTTNDEVSRTILANQRNTASKVSIPLDARSACRCVYACVRACVRVFVGTRYFTRHENRRLQQETLQHARQRHATRRTERRRDARTNENISRRRDATRRLSMRVQRGMQDSVSPRRGRIAKWQPTGLLYVQEIYRPWPFRRAKGRPRGRYGNRQAEASTYPSISPDASRRLRRLSPLFASSDSVAPRVLAASPLLVAFPFFFAGTFPSLCLFVGASFARRLLARSSDSRTSSLPSSSRREPSRSRSVIFVYVAVLAVLDGTTEFPMNKTTNGIVVRYRYRSIVCQV